ncbi:MAG: glycosyltransferase [Firmicutes bacterium]|uniref:Glycosyltransferase n=1 Tax=Candidatus Onthovivens merdipullorum TaxID=2840889 RepID=A0A9D9GXA9_9BACL|nr:glycosyltransferase [Candidatus Onthovivens merdipullorum]
MKFSVSIVLFNPESKYFEYYKQYSKYFDFVYFIDNSSVVNEDLEKDLKVNKNVKFISNSKNLGIAKALNIALDLAKKDAADFLLTMDQDSIFPFHDLEKIKSVLIKKANEKIGIIGLNINKKEEGEELILKDWLITSGNFIFLNNIGNISFNEDLFIDCVDTDFCFKLSKKSLKVYYFSNFFIKHKIGNPTFHKFLFFKFKSFNYSPLRYYYIFRNITFLYKESHRDPFFKKLYYKTRILWFIEILFYEDYKVKKIKAIKSGLKDAKNKRLGPCQLNLV